MKILLDECLPRPLAQRLPGHYVRTVPQMGRASILNGVLLKPAEAEFEVFITVNNGLRYQQNLLTRHLSVTHVTQMVLCRSPGRGEILVAQDVSPGSVARPHSYSPGGATDWQLCVAPAGT